MANPVYDPEGTKKQDQTAPGKVSYNSGSSPASGLRSQEEAAGEDNPEGSDNNGLYNPGGESSTSTKNPQSKSKSESPDRLKTAEQSGDGGLFNSDGDKLGKLAKLRQLKNRSRLLKSRLFNSKWFVGFGAGAGLGTIALIVILLMLVGSLKIPHLIENIAAYQFAKVTRQMAVNSNNLTSTKLAIDAADDSTWNKIKGKYTSNTGKAKDLHEKLTNKYSPAKIVQNYQTSEHFKPIYSSGSLFRGPKLIGVTLDNKTYRVQGPSGLKRFVPGMKTVYSGKDAKVLAPYLQASLKTDNIGPLVRSRTMALMRQELGVSLVAWKLGQYKGLTADEATLKQARDFNSTVAKDNAASAKTTEVKKTIQDAKETLDKNVQNDKKLRTILANKGVDPEVVAKVENALTSSGGLLKSLASFLNPTYSVALPICLIYDGSIQNNAETMNAENAQLRRTYNYVSTAAGQQKHGLDAEGEAVEALNRQLGDIQKSNSEVRASGGIYNTAGYQSAQASPAGDFTIFDAIFGGTAGQVTNVIANTTCPVATNLVFGAAVGAVNVAVCLVPIVGQGACLGEQAVKEGAKTFMGRLAGKIITKVANEEKGQTATAVGGVVQKGAKSAAKTGAAVVAGTILARSIVYSHANMNHNGLQQDTDLANDVDNGGALEASAVMQRQFYGRPLTDSEAGNIQDADRKSLVLKNESLSIYDRYASINNANSLISNLALSLDGMAQSFNIRSFFSAESLFIKPFSSVAQNFGSIFAPSAIAASENVSADTNYGNVTWGFSPSEIKLIRDDESYLPLDNQRILDESSKEEDIEKKYKPCYDGEKQMGDMLADGDIKRTDSGDVVRGEGLCSPDNLSFNSPDELAVNNSPDTPNTRDLIFRWRVAHGYDNSLDALIDQQEVTEDKVVGADTSSPETGDAQELAKQILENNKINLSGRLVKEDIEAAARGENGSADVKTSAKILSLMLAIAKEHTVVVTALQSGGTGHCDNTPKAACPNNAHYNGNGIDFGSLDGKLLSGRDSGSLTIIKIAGEVLPKGTGVGESNCGSSASLPEGFTTFTDSCDHLHLQIPKDSQ